MMLCMDEDGNVYQSASHRSDGQGVESMPHPADNFRDNTLDQSYNKLNSEIESERQQMRVLDAEQDYQNEVAQAHAQKQASITAMKQSVADENLIDKANQELMFKEATENKALSGLADFESLRIVDETYPSKQKAAMGYLNEMMGTKVSPDVVQPETDVIPYSGQDTKEIELEMMANSLRKENDLTKEWAEHQSVPNDVENSVDLADGALIKTTSIETVEDTKKSKTPIIVGVGILAYLLMGG